MLMIVNVCTTVREQWLLREGLHDSSHKPPFRSPEGGQTSWKWFSSAVEVVLETSTGVTDVSNPLIFSHLAVCCKHAGSSCSYKQSQGSLPRHLQSFRSLSLTHPHIFCTLITEGVNEVTRINVRKEEKVDVSNFFRFSRDIYTVVDLRFVYKVYKTKIFCSRKKGGG